MRVGVQFQTHGTTASASLDGAVAAVEAGVDSVWVWDHLVPFTQAPPSVAWEAWTLLGALGRDLAGCGVTLGVLVSPLTFRQPAVLARSAATVASLSRSRVVLGVGAGGFVHDDRLVGTVFDQPERMRRFAEGCRLLRQQVDEVNTNQRTDVRLWVGGDGVRVTIPTAASCADGWSGFGPRERFAQRVEVLNRCIVESGRVIGDVAKSVLVTRHDADTTFQQWRDAGADEVVVSVRPDGSGGYDTAFVRQLSSQRG